MKKQNKSELVEEYIRNAIATCRWKPGERLPSEEELGGILCVSQTTLRIALKTLSNEGLIDRRQRAGSYVSNNIKKQTVLIISNLEQLTLPSGYLARQEIMFLQKKIDKDGFNPILCMGHGRSPKDLAESINLENHPAFKDAAGIIGLQSLLGIKELVKSRGIPTVEIVSGGDVIGNATEYDLKNMNKLFFEILKRHGFSEVAIFTVDDTQKNPSYNAKNCEKFFEHYKKDLLKHAKETGIAIPEEWFIKVPWSWDWSQASDIFKKFWKKVTRKPKAILFTQDALTLYALNAIKELEIKVPEELAILTHANKGINFNFPQKLHSVVFDIEKATNSSWSMLKHAIGAKASSQKIQYIEPYEVAGETLPPIAWGSSDFFKITTKTILRSEAYTQNAGVWKSVSTYSFTEGMERYMVESDIFGQDRYCNFREMLSDDNGKKWHQKEFLLDNHNDDSAIKEAISELFVGLDPIGNSVYRGYKIGSLDYSSKKHSKSFDSFTQNGDILLDVSRNGGKDFRTVLNISLLAMELGFKSVLHVSCSELKVFPNGKLVIPLYFDSLDSTDNCKRYSPVMLLGTPLDGGKHQWHFGDVMNIDKKLSPDGISESSIAILDDGRLLCVGRGGNNGDVPCPSQKWMAISSDQGETWSDFEALKYTDDSLLYSPCTCGYLLKKSDGRLFYVTNIFSSNDQIDYYGPRNQLNICEIDLTALKVKKDSVFCIDHCFPGESENLALSNFWIYEDRETADIVITYPRCFAESEEYSDINLILCRIACSVDNCKEKGKEDKSSLINICLNS